MYVYGACLFYVCCSDCVVVCGNVCCVAAVVKNSGFSLGGGLITYIKSDTTFTHLKTPQTINTDNTEIQLLKIHTNTSRTLP